MSEGDLRECAAKAALNLGFLAKAAEDAPKYAVHDWAYEDKGVEKYARTPEMAGRLRDRGVKLTPVYTRCQD